MRSALALAAVFFGVLTLGCAADTYAPPTPTDYGGPSTVSTLPSASSYTGQRFTVTDLGGVLPGGAAGSGPVYSIGSCWRRVVQSVTPLVVQAATTISVSALSQSSFVQLTAPPSLLTNVAINAVGLCPGDIITIYVPNGVLTAAGTLGVSLNTANAITVTGIGSAYSADFLWTGTAALKVRGGPVQ